MVIKAILNRYYKISNLISTILQNNPGENQSRKFGN